MTNKSDYFIHETAVIDEPSEIGAGTKIWHFSHVLKDTTIGRNCTIGQNVAIGPKVTVGDGCKIQNNVNIYNGVTIGDEVFIGPAVTFTNDLHPSAVGEWLVTPTVVGNGASIGANATIVCGVTIGEGAVVGAGSVVIDDVPARTLVVGNPARFVRLLTDHDEPVRWGE